MDVQLPSLRLLLEESGICPDELIDTLDRHLEDVQELIQEYPPYDLPLEFLEVERYRQVINEFFLIVFQDAHRPGGTAQPASKG